MFARILEFGIMPQKREELIAVIKNEVLPILKTQVGFLEILPFFPVETTNPAAINVSVWATKEDAERYVKVTYPKILAILKPFLTTPVTTRVFTLETALCEHLVEALAA